MKVDKLRTAYPRYRLYGLLYLAVPKLGAGYKSWMTVGYRCHLGNDDTYLWIGKTQRVDKGKIVAYKLVPVVWPITWVGVVDAKKIYVKI